MLVAEIDAGNAQISRHPPHRCRDDRFNRSAELSDWVADTLGVLIGIGLDLAYRHVR